MLYNVVFTYTSRIIYNTYIYLKTLYILSMYSMFMSAIGKQTMEIRLDLLPPSVSDLLFVSWRVIWRFRAMACQRLMPKT